MINKIYGTVNTEPIVFYKNEKDQWECEIPSIENGKYVVELYAQDDAGNETYFATVLFSIDFKKLMFSFEWIKIGELENTSNDFFIKMDEVMK